MKCLYKDSKFQRSIALVIEQVDIVENNEIAEGIWRMSMHAPNVAELYRGPGQFINLLASDSWDHLIRRPMSIASVKGSTIEIIYKIFGEMTQQFSHKVSGESMNVMGPLGNVFTIQSDQNDYPVLIGGGVGLAPILNLYHDHSDSVLIIGARNNTEHFLEHDPENMIYLTTDDGSVGISGNVLDALKEIKLPDNTILYACGPEPMLKAVQKFAQENSIKAQLSVESYMGCGVGLCQGCVIERKNGQIQEHSYHEKYSLVCVDGPVYDSEEVTFG